MDGSSPKHARIARSWHMARINRFVETQRRRREWINFAEIADWCSELNGSGRPDEAAREHAFKNLEQDLLSGDFEESGRSRVLYLHPGTVKTRMTREWLQDATENNYDGHRGRSQFLPQCWISRDMFERWAAKHNLPSSPPRFSARPLNADVKVSKTAHDGQPAQPGSRGGRKRTFDRVEAEQFVFQQMDKLGDFADEGQTDDWSSKSDVEAALSRHFEDHGHPKPSVSTARRLVSDAVDKWRDQQRHKKVQNGSEN